MPQTVLITGCSSGLGYATALFFAKKEWNVIATMRHPDDASDLATLPNVLVTRLDVTDVQTIRASIRDGIERFGCVDVLINNAGYGASGIFEAIPAEQVREQFEVNLFGVMNTIREILPHFRSRKSGIIVNISSGSGVFATPANTLYCASKFALEGFSEAISYELASQGVRMKIIEPGGIFSTRFFGRAAKESAANFSLPDYDTFAACTRAFAAKLNGWLGGTEEDVTACIHAAVTDGTRQLRYVATKDIEPLIHARRETSEEKYMSLMLDSFEKGVPFL